MNRTPFAGPRERRGHSLATARPRRSNGAPRAGRLGWPALLPLLMLAGVAGAAETTPALDSIPAHESDAAHDSASAPDSLSGPDLARITLVGFALMNFNNIRVFTDSTRFFSHRAVASSEGVWLRPTRWGTSITEYSEDRLVPWSEIESIKVRRGASGLGPVTGAMIGLAIGLTFYMAQVPVAILSLGERQPSGTPILVGLVGGATLGWLAVRPGPWRTVYP